MMLARASAKLLALGVVLALIRHLVLWEAVVTDPAALLRKVERLPAIEEWAAARALAMIEGGTHQPVDLRGATTMPFIGNQVAWQLPLPHSLTIFARYREAARAATKPLIFVVAAGEREAGLRVARALCEDLGRRHAALVVGGL
jgi:hypothetical protein